MPGRWIAPVAFAAAALAVWMTLRADFLAYPGWLAAQKADIILGPVLVGLYWLRRRPASRFGPLLIVVGLVGGVPVHPAVVERAGPVRPRDPVGGRDLHVHAGAHPQLPERAPRGSRRARDPRRRRDRLARRLCHARAVLAADRQPVLDLRLRGGLPRERAARRRRARAGARRRARRPDRGDPRGARRARVHRVAGRERDAAAAPRARDRRPGRGRLPAGAGGLPDGAPAGDRGGRRLPGGPVDAHRSPRRRSGTGSCWRSSPRSCSRAGCSGAS